jgi:hypothetical protein
VADHEWRRLQGREAEIDLWFKDAKDAVYDPHAYSMRRLEKTIIMATAAIVEAIWKARM